MSSPATEQPVVSPGSPANTYLAPTSTTTPGVTISWTRQGERPATWGNPSGGPEQIMVGTGQTYTTHPAVAPYGAYAGMGMDYPTTGIGYQTVPASVFAGDVQRWGLSLDPNDQARYLEATGLMQDAGLLGDNFTVDEASAAWQKVLLGASYNQSLAPYEYLQTIAAQGAFAQQQDTGPVTSTYSSTSTETNTSSSTDTDTVLTNEFDARAILDGALLNYLGRRATDKERAQFLASLNRMEQANPTVTQRTGTSTTTSSTNASETTTPAQPGRQGQPSRPGPSSENGPNTRTYVPPTPATGSTTSRTSTSSSNTVASRNSTQTGGFNQEQYAIDYARSNPLYAETQAATTLMSWLERAIMNSQQRRMI